MDSAINAINLAADKQLESPVALAFHTHRQLDELSAIHPARFTEALDG